MKLLHMLMTRRTFLQHSAALSIVTAKWRTKTDDASPLNQSIAQLGGYGVGTFGQGSYPGATNKNYLPFVSKEQN